MEMGQKKFDPGREAARPARRFGRTLVPAVMAWVYALALALWAGGLVTLGAVVAPIVFRVVNAPLSEKNGKK